MQPNSDWSIDWVNPPNVPGHERPGYEYIPTDSMEFSVKSEELKDFYNSDLFAEAVQKFMAGKFIDVINDWQPSDEICPDCGSPTEVAPWWDDTPENGGEVIGTLHQCTGGECGWFAER